LEKDYQFFTYFEVDRLNYGIDILIFIKDIFMKKYCILFVFCLLTISTFSQNVTVLTSGEKTSIRGLSVVSDKILWVSGSNGMIGRSVDGGTTWKWGKIPCRADVEKI
jgi:hypothetical protein